MSVVLKANWNYPTRVWAGPGRIAELGAACSELGIRRPLLVTEIWAEIFLDGRGRRPA